MGLYTGGCVGSPVGAVGESVGATTMAPEDTLNDTEAGAPPVVCVVCMCPGDVVRCGGAWAMECDALNGTARCTARNCTQHVCIHTCYNSADEIRCGGVSCVCGVRSVAAAAVVV